MTVITEYTRGSVEASHAAVEVPGTDGVRLVLSYPATDDYLWDEYLSGAWESYRRHGAQAALDVPAVRDGVSTSLFYALVDGDGVVVGGVRAQGPYVCASQSHAMVEWTGNRALDAVRETIAARIPEGGGNEIGVGIPRVAIRREVVCCTGEGGVADDGATAVSFRAGHCR